MVDERRPLQNKILQVIAQNESPIIVQKIADLLDRSAPAILESIKPLFEQKLLTSEQEVIRGKRLIRLTNKGALTAIAHMTVSYSTVYKNHPYLQMPSIVTELAECGADEVFSARLVNFFALRLFYGNLKVDVEPDGRIVLDDKVGTNHFLTALLFHIMHVVLDDPNSLKRMHREKTLKLITKSKVLFNRSYDDLSSKLGPKDNDSNKKVKLSQVTNLANKHQVQKAEFPAVSKRDFEAQFKAAVSRKGHT